MTHMISYDSSHIVAYTTSIILVQKSKNNIKLFFAGEYT